MAPIQKLLFGKIADKELATDLAKLCGDIYFGCAAWLLIFSMPLSAPRLVLAAIIYGACGYFTRFKRSRVAASIGMLLSIVLFIALSVAFEGGTGPLFAFAVWAGLRGIQATCKLHGAFSIVESSGSPEP